MDIDLLGFAGPRGWPEPGCRCASCSRLRAASVDLDPTRIVVDGRPLAKCAPRPVSGGFEVRTASGVALIAEAPDSCPRPSPGTRYDAVLLDLAGRPEHLGFLRHVGAVGPQTQVYAIHADHRLASPAELSRRTSLWVTPQAGPHRTLLLGGSRSGKSAEAELRLLSHPDVTYIATGGTRPGDSEWASRIQAHRSRRPAWWNALETTDLAGNLRSPTSEALLIDGMGTWLAAAMDDCGAWDDPAAMQAAVRPQIDVLVEAWRRTPACVVAVSEEVGLSLVPDNPGGRAFRDLLGELNQRLVAESEASALIVAGRAVDLPG